MRLIPPVLAVLMLAGCALSPDTSSRVAASPGAKAGSSNVVVPLARVQQRNDQRRHVCASSGVRANRGGYC